MTVSQEETPYTLGERLRCCRQECQYSVEDIAALLKRKPKTIRQYEDDTRPVPFKDLWLLSCLPISANRFMPISPLQNSPHAIFCSTPYIRTNFINAAVQFPNNGNKKLFTTWQTTNSAILKTSLCYIKKRLAFKIILAYIK